MHSDKFIRNTWYLAGRSADFEAGHSAMRLLGDPIATYRAPD